MVFRLESRLSFIEAVLGLIGLVLFSVTALSVINMVFVTNNTFSTNFSARTFNTSTANPNDVYPVVCQNITIGNTTKTFNGKTLFYSTCGKSRNPCAEVICNIENSCIELPKENVNCSASYDCPSLDDVCDISMCQCVNLNITSGGGGGGPGVIVAQETGNIDLFFGIRLRNFGGVIQNIFIQRTDQTVAEWVKLNYNWGASQVHSVTLNYDFEEKIFDVSVIALDDPGVNSITSYNFTEIPGLTTIDSFESLILARSGQFLIMDRCQFSGQDCSPNTYPGTTTFVTNFYPDSTSPNNNFVNSFYVMLDGSYSGQEVTKLEIIFGRNAGVGPVLFNNPDFFQDVIL